MGYSTRKRLQEIEEREAAGESLWKRTFDRGSLVKLDELWTLLTDEGLSRREQVSEHLTTAMRLSDGWDIRYSLYPGTFRASTDREAEFILDVIEHLVDAIEEFTGHGDDFARHVSHILNEHRIAYRLVDGEIVPVSSDELHREVVEPTLRLLVGEKFAGAHQSYLKALKEIQNNDPGDAITDAGTALQETLEALDCQGKVLGRLIKDAKTKGLLGNHDEPMAESITKWVAAERNNGEAHHAGEPELADAWLMVHVVGALIVRLADPATPRGGDGQ